MGVRLESPCAVGLRFPFQLCPEVSGLYQIWPHPYPHWLLYVPLVSGRASASVLPVPMGSKELIQCLLRLYFL